ncbi:MAG: ParB/RepB/Spo0J family partition protein [bacterium]|nr:ParB/RepB/Spo0J family partition protein [bacterium]
MVDRRLGRGLDFFLSGGRGGAKGKPGAEETPAEKDSDTLELDVKLLEPNPDQPRGPIDPEELRELAASIQSNGILQPILARKAGERYQIVAGERRWRAAQIAKLTKVPVLVREISDDDSAVFALVENVQREDLNAIEKAKAFQQLQGKLEATQEQVAKRVGLTRSSVTNFLRLLELPAAVQEHVSRGTLAMGHARSLLGLVDKELIVPMADEAIRGTWSVRALEERVREANEATTQPDKPAKTSGGKGSKNRPVWLKELEETLMDNLATPVNIRYGRKRSQIQIECGSREEFERIFERLKNV